MNCFHLYRGHQFKSQIEIKILNFHICRCKIYRVIEKIKINQKEAYIMIMFE